MSTDLDVYVVLNSQTGLWDAACCNDMCGYGAHEVSDDNTSKTAAEKAATQHRAELRKEIADKTTRAEQIEQGSAVYWQDTAKQRERELARAKRDLETAQAAIARVRRLCDLTIAASCRVQAIEQARDTLAALDPPEEP